MCLGWTRSENGHLPITGKDGKGKDGKGKKGKGKDGKGPPVAVYNG